MSHSIQQLPSSPLLRSSQQEPIYPEHDDAFDLRTVLNFLRDNRWFIVAITLVVMLMAAAYVFMAKPIYEANLVVQVEDNPNSSGNIFGEQLSKVFDLKSAASAEMEILRSRMVLSRAVEATRLYIDVRPNYLPVIGQVIARYNKQLSEPGVLGLDGYVWGNEKAEVSVFNVPRELEGTTFVLTAGRDQTFRLSHEDEGIELNGRVGEIVKMPRGSGEIMLRVDRLAAKPGAEFLLARASQLDTVIKLQEALKILEKGKQSGIIGVSLEGESPDVINGVLGAIGREYVYQNEARKSENAEKSLAFLNRQLPLLKQELEQSEKRYNEFRNRHGVVDLGEEARTALQQTVTAQTKLFDLKQKKEELLIRFQEEHPSVMSINQQIAVVLEQLSLLGAKIKSLPQIEQEAVRLARDVKVNTDVYTSLLSNAQQLRLTTSSRVGNVRLLDSPAVPGKPVKPRKLLVLAIAGMLGLVLAALAALVRKSLYGRVNYPHEIEQQLGVPLCAIIPHNEQLDGARRAFQQPPPEPSTAPLMLTNELPSEKVMESLRRFRGSLQFAMSGNENNIVVITGPTPGVGKSFVSANFSAVLAAAGKRVILVDGDLRTGFLHRYFGLQRENGLSEVVSGSASLEKVIHHGVAKGVDFIATGRLPPAPGEIVASKTFGDVLRLLSSRYDFVLIDTAPILSASDTLSIAPYAGATFNVVRGGTSTVEEIEETVKQLNRVGVSVTGTVFNDLKARPARYGYGSKYGMYGYAE